MKKISVFYDHILQAMEQTNRTRLDLLREVKAEGIDALEISATHLKKNYRQLKEELKESGLTISCIYETYDWGKRGLWLSAKKQVDLAKQVGASTILVIPGFLSEKEAAALNEKSASYEETTIFMNANDKIQNMKAALIKLVAYASTKGVSVTLEDYDGYTAPFARMYQLKWFMLNVPGLKFTLDMGNFSFSDEDVKQAYTLLSQYIVHVHCKDRAEDAEITGTRYNLGLNPVPCGKGYLPIGELVNQLSENGYDGYLAIEHFEAPDQVAFMKASAAYLKDICE
ncbi:MAG TPA: sugar phosphate isomerase/epimerase [Lachnospiraceae bacterium]|nr:sugar phosphate isomerase/epimerase [Lachnospiraceae bacterium]